MRQWRRWFGGDALLVLIAVAGGVLGLLGWRLVDRGAPPPVEPEAAAERIEHVHGLGITAGEVPFLATHSGLFKGSSSGFERVGTSFQDVMGLTVTAGGSLLASGHPDVAGLRRGDPGLLGLIESTDLGRSWNPLSLRGEADLHLLLEAHSRLYAWDAATASFMVSEDRKSWDRRSVIEMTSFAVDPASPDRVLAQAAGQLVLSTDRGATWQVLPGPETAFVVWDAQAGVWAIGDDGAAFMATAPEDEWVAQDAAAPSVEAATASNGKVYVVALAEGRPVVSVFGDRGRWQPLRRSSR